MKTKIFLVVLTMSLVQPCMAQVDIDRLESSIETLQAYQYDKTNGVDLAWVELQVGQASVDDSVRQRVEEKLLDALAKARHNDAKQFLLRQLRTIGTVKSVPPLALLLTEADTSYMAIYVLGRIPVPEALSTFHCCLHQAIHQAFFLKIVN